MESGKNPITQYGAARDQETRLVQHVIGAIGNNLRNKHHDSATNVNHVFVLHGYKLLVCRVRWARKG